MLLLLGLVMCMVGVALWVNQEVKLPGQYRLRTAPARWAGTIFLSYLPLVFGGRYLLDSVLGNQFHYLYWSLAFVCVTSALIIIYRSAESTAPPKKRVVAEPQPALSEVPTETVGADFPLPPPPKDSRSPFDFT